MTSSNTLAVLRDIQRLRQAREEASHAAAIRSQDAADAALQETQEQLEVVEQNLEKDFDQGQLELNRFRILTARISELSQTIDVRQDELGAASSVEIEAHSARVSAERRTEYIEEQYAIAERKERRRSEDLSARNFISLSAALDRKRP